VRGDALKKKMMGKKLLDKKHISAVLISILALSSLLALMPTAAQEEKKIFRGAWPYSMPPTGHLNSYVSGHLVVGIYQALMEMPLAMYFYANNSWLPLLATSWSVNVPAATFTVNLRQGVKWSDGTTFTAKDVVSTFYMGYLFKWAIWMYIDSVRAVDDYTVAFHMSKLTNLCERFIIREYMRAYNTYGNFSDQVQTLRAQGKTSADPEMKTLYTQATNYRPTKLIVTGPFTIDVPSITEAEMVLVKNPNSYIASRVLFDEIRLYQGETAQITPFVLAKEVDYATHGFPAATISQFRELGIRVIPADCHSSSGITFNFAKYPLNVKEVRQAIALAVDRKLAGSMPAPAWLPQGDLNYSIPMYNLFAERWVEPDALAKLDHYGWETGGNRTRARLLLLSIGAYIDPADGIWTMPNGTKLDFEWVSQGEYVDVMAISESCVDQLNDFGIKVTLRPITFTAYLANFREGKWDLTLGLGGSSHPHPYYSLYNLYYYSATFGAGPSIGVNTSEIWYTEAAGPVNFTDLMVKSAEGFDIEAQKEAITKYMLAYNELVFHAPVWHRFSGNPALEDVRVTGWPPPQDPVLKNDPYQDSFVIVMLLTGILKPVVKEAPPPPRPPYELYAGAAAIVVIVIVAAIYVLRKR